MASLTIHGTVISGAGTGSKFISIPWAQQQIEAKLGFPPYRGTLNLQLPHDRAAQIKRRLQKSKGITLAPAPGYFPARCFKASIMHTINGAIVLPQTPDYPPTLLEVIAPIDLRQALALADGDKVKLTIALDGP
jgi:CTP-dependent riboflavin kinase